MDLSNDYKYVSDLFNSEMNCHEHVPVAVMMDSKRIDNLTYLFKFTDLTSETISNYFNHCATSDNFKWYRERSQFDLTWYLSTDAYKIAKERK